MSAMPFIHGAFQGDRGTLPRAASTVQVHVQTRLQSGPWNNFPVSSLGKSGQGTTLALNCCKCLTLFAASSLGESSPARSRARAWTCAGYNPWDQSCHIIQDAQWLSCWQLLPSDGPGGGSRLEVAHRQLVLGGVSL